MAQRTKALAGTASRDLSSKKVSTSKEKRPKKRSQGKNMIFALDIGTRSIVGIAGERLDRDNFIVKDYELIEHPGRAMMDGQVEDIAQVSRLIVEVTHRLEARLGISLTRVSIAAAGRMLRTARVNVSRELPSPLSQVDRDMVLGLEGEAIELAQEQVKKEELRPDGSNYYCVGYSIVEYQMDGHLVSQLEGHTCSKISVELIAAFLPYGVVEGLYAAVDMSRLEVSNLTLEPIAAMNALLPRELRLLNLALVDVGAGTSDIAICRDGRIVSYDMATIAGDELSEAIVREYLVDFPTAERLKRSLSTEEDLLKYENILGVSCEVKPQSILEIIKPTVDLLAQTVADKILNCNGGPPSAVFLIGGGSLIPGLNQALAAYLKISPDNVAVGPRRSLKDIDASAFPALTGPEFVTPLGIAITAIIQPCFQFFGVTINGRRLKLLNVAKTRLMDVLLMAGFKAGQLIAHSGRSLLFTLNGAPCTLRGGLPEHAVVTINGSPASIESDVRPGDVILVTPARDGEPAAAIASDFIPKSGYSAILVNGESAKPDRRIVPGDKVDILPLAASSDPIAPPDLKSTVLESAPYEKTTLPPQTEFSQEPLVFTPMPQDGLAPEQPQKSQAPSPESVWPAPDKKNDASETTGSEAASGATLGVTLNGQPLSLPLSNGQSAYFMLHLLKRAGVDPSDPKGRLVLECDGSPVGFMHPLRNGARVQIGWK